MKNCYFTEGNIHDKSLEMLRKLVNSRKIARIKFEPERSALLILDMQNYFLDERSHAFIPSARPILPNIQSLAEAYDEMDVPVILTSHINTGDNAGLMASWWNDLITENSELSDIVPELNIPNAIVVKKTQYDGFYRTPLEDILREKDVSQVVITGVMTHLCCETTARSAFVRGFAVFFPIDSTATYNEDFHRATFLNLSHGFAVPVLTSKLLEQLTR